MEIPYWAPPPDRPFAREVGARPGSLRIGVTRTRLDGSPLHPAVTAALEETVALCIDLGRFVEDAQPQIDFARLSRHMVRLWASGVSPDIDAIRASEGRAFSPDLVEPMAVSVYEFAKRTTAPDYPTSLTALHKGAREVAAFFSQYDVWLYPTLNGPPLILGEIDTSNRDAAALYKASSRYVSHTWVHNMSGGAAISLPLAQTHDGLPVGMSFAADFGADSMLIRLAAQLEEARPWIARKPQVWG